MKKVSFSFLCDRDHTQMPADGNTRYCAQCSRNIVDYTGMSAPEIAARLKTAVKPCGFMLPWQLDELNDHLRQERSNFIINRLSRLAKIAAVVSAPLVVHQATAQTFVPVVPENTGGQGAQGNELLVKAVDGTPLCGLEFEVMNNKGERIDLLKTDATGKIYLHYNTTEGPITLRNPATGIEKNIVLKAEPVCMVWETRLTAQLQNAEVKQEHNYRFVFKLIKDGKTTRMGYNKVRITLYDSLNREIGQISSRTGAKGQITLKDEELKGAAHISFSFYSKKGFPRTAYATLRYLEMEKNNELEVYEHEPMLMGIMIE